MSTLENPKRIICVLPKDRAITLIKRLHKEKGIDTCNFHRGRGRSSNVGESIKYGAYAETDVLTIIVDGNRADEIFEFIFFEAEINHLHGGFIYQIPISKSTVFTLPDIPEETDE